MQTGISVSSLQPRVLTVFPSMSVAAPKDPVDRVKLMCRAIDRFKTVLKGKSFPTNTGADFTGNAAVSRRTSGSPTALLSAASRLRLNRLVPH